MSLLGNRTLFLFCTTGFLSIRWPGNRVRLKQETTARFLTAITDVQGSDCTGLQRRDLNTDRARGKMRWTPKTPGS